MIPGRRGHLRSRRSEPAELTHYCPRVLDVKSAAPLSLLRNTNRVSNLLAGTVPSLQVCAARCFRHRASGNDRCALPAPDTSFHVASWPRISEHDSDLREGYHFSTSLPYPSKGNPQLTPLIFCIHSRATKMQIFGRSNPLLDCVGQLEEGFNVSRGRGPIRSSSRPFSRPATGTWQCRRRFCFSWVYEIRMDRWEKMVRAPIRLDMFVEIPLMILFLMFGTMAAICVQQEKKGLAVHPAR